MTLDEYLSGLASPVRPVPPSLRSAETLDDLIAEGLGLIRQDHARAGLLAQAALRLAEALRDDASRGKAARFAGHVHLLAGRAKRAVRRYESAWRRFAANPIEQAHTSVAMIQALSYVGEYDRAFEVAEFADRTYLEAGEPFRAARLKANLGNILHRLDRLEEAEAAYRSALPVLAEHQAEADLAIVMRNFGVVLMSLQKHDEADRMYARAREVFTAAGDTLLIFEIDLNRAYLLGRRGEVLEALRSYRSLLDRLPSDSGYEIGHCLLDQADFLLAAGLWTDAVAAAERAEAVFAAIEARFEIGKARILAAMALVRKGRSAEARARLASARPLLRREPNRNWRAMAELCSAETEWKAGRHGAAFRRLALALSAGPSPDLRPIILRESALAAIRLGRWVDAEELIEELDAPDLRARLARAQGEQNAAEREAEAAIRKFDAERSRLASVGLRRGAALAHQEMLVECLACLREPGARLGVVSRMKDHVLAEMVQLPARLAGAGRAWDPERRRLSPDQERSMLAELRERDILMEHSPVAEPARPAPGEGERWIELFAVDGVLRAIVLEGSSVRDHALAEELEVGEIARFFHLNRVRESGRTPRLTAKSLTRLARLLIPVLEGAPSRLIIGRDAALRNLPIHAVPWEDGSLLDACDVFYAPSLAVAEALRTRGGERGRGTALIGMADRDAPQIDAELREVASVCETSPLTSLADFERAAENAAVVHIAAHGLLREDQPIFNAMKLGQAEWTVFDALHLRLRADLCVLSGCSTGVTVVEDSLAAEGFIESLLAAGCRSVVASLWDTADEPNAFWMSCFYRHLRTDPAAAAYRKASQQTRDVWPNPGDWAPFGFFGCPPQIPVSNMVGPAPLNQEKA
ncbi:MAG: CHAT domain-containing protein [Fimbriimonadaceae bacterium]|nr:CHAT domain-containing protein [Fimbriimonadaceae bacterium]